ncbi:hypothetical protein VHP8226_00961 [Vibrio hippocampi]|uniref:Uncharacterized protein n=2 Tax=Vibrio hippocampi TaxID=654686 RepID=A0ABM8ZH32_9VIBR|nr:hypothetical protein VHP8226_00961 [Vibrio hippocampi]
MAFLKSRYFLLMVASLEIVKGTFSFHSFTSIEMNNAMCLAFIETKRKALYDYFLKHPRVTRAFRNEYSNSFTPLTLGHRNLHNPATVRKMDDPVSIKLVRARTVLQVSGKKFPIRQDVIWDKTSRSYFDNEFQKGRMHLNEQQSQFLALIIKQVNEINHTIMRHYYTFLELQNLLEDNEKYLGGDHD